MLDYQEAVVIVKFNSGQNQLVSCLMIEGMPKCWKSAANDRVMATTVITSC